MRVGERSTVWCEPGAYLGPAGVQPPRARRRRLAAGWVTSWRWSPWSTCGISSTTTSCSSTGRRRARGVPREAARAASARALFTSPSASVRPGAVSRRFSDTAGAINYDTAGADPTVVYDTRDASGEPLQFQLGCGTLPEALETSFRLAVPKEVFRVTLNDATHPRHGYVGEDQPGASAVFAAHSRVHRGIQKRALSRWSLSPSS